MSKILPFRRSIFQAVAPGNTDILQSIGMPEKVAESLPLRFARLTGVSMAIAILSAFCWSAIAMVHETSTAIGQLVPEGLEQPVQVFEGGLVKQVMVRAGDFVEKDAPIALLTDAETAEDSQTLEHQLFDLMAQTEIQKALRDGRDVDLAFLPPAYNALQSSSAEVYRRSRDTLIERRISLLNQQLQAEFDVKTIKAQREAAQNELDYARLSAERYEQLYNKGVVSEIQVAERRRLVIKAEADLAALQAREGNVKTRLDDVIQQKKRFEAETDEAYAKRIADIQANMTVIESALKKKRARQSRLVVTAPIRGFVKSLDIKGPGAVIGPGQVLASIVPADAPLFVEAQIKADQVGYVVPGQAVNVKVSAFDFARYGWLMGKVERISPSSFRTELGGVFYTLRIALDSERLAKAPSARLLPGMEVTADIITGQKSFLQYLMTPLQRTMGSAFAER